jgi:hypothetical protein
VLQQEGLSDATLPALFDALHGPDVVGCSRHCLWAKVLVLVQQAEACVHDSRAWHLMFVATSKWMGSNFRCGAGLPPTQAPVLRA